MAISFWRAMKGQAGALWEIGYQLTNIILQARSLDINAVPKLFDADMRKELAPIPIENPWAVVSLWMAPS